MYIFLCVAQKLAFVNVGVYVCGFVTAYYTQQTLPFKPKNNQKFEEALNYLLHISIWQQAIEAKEYGMNIAEERSMGIYFLQ